VKTISVPDEWAEAYNSPEFQQFAKAWLGFDPIKPEVSQSQSKRLRTVQDVIESLPKPGGFEQLAIPPYVGGGSSGIAFGVASMKHHTTDEGWQIFNGLKHAGYALVGHNLPCNHTDVRRAITSMHPGVVVMQDKREWDVSARDFRDKEARFIKTSSLAGQPQIFKLTILKDSHQRPRYHAEAATEMGCHAWIIYYHPRIVCHNAPYVRPEHLIRTYHSINLKVVPAYAPRRMNCIFSGAMSRAYPMREHIRDNLSSLPLVDYHKHPGYHRKGCETPSFLKLLNRYKVSICTSSIYGYALRKIIESTACGCRVITDLPTDEVMPSIDGNLLRVPPGIPIPKLHRVVQDLCDTYDPATQQRYAQAAKEFYDYRRLANKLVKDIEQLRKDYRDGLNG